MVIAFLWIISFLLGHFLKKILNNAYVIQSWVKLKNLRELANDGGN